MRFAPTNLIVGIKQVPSADILRTAGLPQTGKKRAPQDDRSQRLYLEISGRLVHCLGEKPSSLSFTNVNKV